MMIIAVMIFGYSVPLYAKDLSNKDTNVSTEISEDYTVGTVSKTEEDARTEYPFKAIEDIKEAAKEQDFEFAYADDAETPTISEEAAELPSVADTAEEASEIIEAVDPESAESEKVNPEIPGDETLSAEIAAIEDEAAVVSDDAEQTAADEAVILDSSVSYLSDGLDYAANEEAFATEDFAMSAQEDFTADTVLAAPDIQAVQIEPDTQNISAAAVEVLQLPGRDIVGGGTTASDPSSNTSSSGSTSGASSPQDAASQSTDSQVVSGKSDAVQTSSVSGKVAQTEVTTSVTSGKVDPVATGDMAGNACYLIGFLIAALTIFVYRLIVVKSLRKENRLAKKTEMDLFRKACA